MELQQAEKSKARLGVTIEEVETQGLRFVDKLIQNVTNSKLKELVAEYFLSMMLFKKGGSLLGTLFLVRSQIILLLALAKLVRMGLNFVK